MIVVIEKEKWLELYSDAGKKILETTNGALWNTDEENHIAVDKTRYANGEYVESNEPVDVEEEVTEEVEENEEE